MTLKKVPSILLAVALIVALFAGCQANQKSGSAASSTADSAAANTQHKITNGFIENKSVDVPQLDLKNAVSNPNEENIYGHNYVLRDWSIEKCEEFAKSMRNKGFDSHKEYVGNKVEEFYVFSSDEFYRFSPYEGSLSDLPWKDVTEDSMSQLWCLEWQKTTSTHTDDKPDSKTAFSTIKAYAADYFGGAKYLLDNCLADETSEALYKSMGLKFCRVCTKPAEDTNAYFDQYLVGKSKAVAVSDICHTFDDRLICDIDDDGKAEAVFFDFTADGDIAYFITVIGVENGDPYEKYRFSVLQDDKCFNLLEKCEEISVDEKTQALVLSCPSDDSGKKDSCTIKVTNGELIAE